MEKGEEVVEEEVHLVAEVVEMEEEEMTHEVKGNGDERGRGF